MSGLIGVVGADKATTAGVVHAILHDMPYRASDGTATWHSDDATLGLAYTRSVPQDPESAQVCTDGRYYLISDARLDNRDALVARLAPTNPDIPEPDLILLAYKFWGHECAEHLLGDFAILIFDTSSKSLFAIRDHLGVKPLFYRYQDARLAIASEIKVLRRIGMGFRDLSLDSVVDAQIANFLAHRPNTDENPVFYDGLYRLPAGHTLTYTAGQTPVLRCYWRPQSAVTPLSAQARIETLRVLLKDAVKVRLRSPTSVAILLSGGLDSSTIACCADQIRAKNDDAPIDTFSIVFDKTPKKSERGFIETVLASGNFRPHFLSLDDYAPFEGYEDLIGAQARLFNAPAMMMAHKLIKEVGARGFQFYLDGHGGDEVISHGTGRIHDLARQRRWKALWRELRIPDGDPAYLRLVYFFKYLVRYGQFKGAYRLRQLMATRRAVAISPSFLGPKLAPFENVVAPRPVGESAQHVDALKSVLIQEALELLEQSAAVLGTQARFPFYDKRVVELCLSVPPEEKHDGGWPRLILRKAMDGILPRDIQWRTTKFDFAFHLGRGLMAHHRAVIETILEHDPNEIDTYLDLDVLRASYERAKSAPERIKGGDLVKLWHAIALHLWLQRTRQETSVQ